MPSEPYHKGTAGKGYHKGKDTKSEEKKTEAENFLDFTILIFLSCQPRGGGRGGREGREREGRGRGGRGREEGGGRGREGGGEG